jgi:diaminohydroxyphosphoribosylaminopyrimidine deaminase/5-amino-6-(5-phosphoribosylamino)uracil reductase
MSISASDRMFLLAALDLARLGLYTAPPNPKVGCLIVRDGRVLGRGWHQWTGEGHAEARALEATGGDARGATVYVSLEPCAFHGRTPSCAEALIRHGVARVVVAMTDPHPRVSGQGLRMLNAAGIATELLDLPEAHALNPGLEARHLRGRPWVRVKVAASLDGRTAMASGESRWITGEAARADVQRLRARSDAIVTGVGTILADDPRLTVRDSAFGADGRIRQPLRVIADSRLRTPADAAVLREPGAVLFAHADGVVGAAPIGSETLACGDERVDPERLLSALAARECSEVLIEAGATFTGAVLASGLWDELIVYSAPCLLGVGARPFAAVAFERLADAIRGRICDTQMVGEDLKVTFERVAA